jgi:Entner-Doudoroff aldolase
MSSRRHETLERLQASPASAIIRTGDAETARLAMEAAVGGGFRVVEFTLTTPGALELVAEFSARPDLLVGAGTVLQPLDVRRAVEAGARFVVSPVCDPEVIREAAACEAVSIPGTFTPTEMIAAQRAGADLVKLFPAPANVAEYISAVLGPLPSLRIFPTAGVTLENCVEVLRSGAFGVGFVRALFDPRDLADRRFKAIEERAARLIARVREARPL